MEPVIEKIKGAIETRKTDARAFVVGITGIDLSGKTEFTQRLASALSEIKHKVAIIHLDDFHNPRDYRNAGPDPVQNYWESNFNIDSLIISLLAPLKRGEEFQADLKLLNLRTDRYEVEKQFTFDRETIVLFEGVFLFRRELIKYLDYKIYLDISFEESRRRALRRDLPLYGDEFLTRYETKYWPAQKRYLEEYPPARFADLVIDNTDWRNPRIID
jgi:uridine kinase